MIQGHNSDNKTSAQHFQLSLRSAKAIDITELTDF